MNDAKARRWARWHARGYRTFLLAHLGVVLAFYAVSGTIAYVHLHATMPESVRERGGTVPIWPAILVVAVMTPLSVVWSHLVWKRNERRYEEARRRGASPPAGHG
jgi:hypothetical protein